MWSVEPMSERVYQKGAGKAGRIRGGGAYLDDYPALVYFVGFDFGRVGIDQKDSVMYVRAVR